MKLVSFIILITCLQITGDAFGQQDRRISIKADSLPLTKLLKLIEKKSGYRFVYRNDLLPANSKVSINVNNALTEDILRKILKNTGLTFK
ncbi:STN domain-containing protein, partial [Chitinophaga sp.]|uniref:STN domain-containing protein n=1 Tax=Chitinophaga sp. TaxID=1869181 RepID=UPI002F94E008